mmetsp:Transcript_15345/g.31191  ORF Transcript_15345/g.31191 Transcript_15345/m.31191 type:complete len:200 (+) Transcript_15345:585-1184(+)
MLHTLLSVIVVELDQVEHIDTRHRGERGQQGRQRWLEEHVPFENHVLYKAFADGESLKGLIAAGNKEVFATRNQFLFHVSPILCRECATTFELLLGRFFWVMQSLNGRDARTKNNRLAVWGAVVRESHYSRRRVFTDDRNIHLLGFLLGAAHVLVAVHLVRRHSRYGLILPRGVVERKSLREKTKVAVDVFVVVDVDVA